MGNLKMFIPMTKVDEEKRLVYGIATQEIKDKANEVMDYDSSKPNFEKWSQDIEKATGGKSLGNVREMHTTKAAGKLTQLNFNDDAKAIEVCAKVVDEDSWNKVKEGVLTGFSIGGSYAKRWRDEQDNTRFTAQPAEISLVDNPCVPTATFQVIKANGITEQRQFKNKEQNMDDIKKSILDEFQKALANKDLAKAFSFEEIQERIRGAINSKIHTPFNQGYFWIIQTYTDHVVIQGDLDGDGDNDMFSVPYTIDGDGKVEIGSDIKQVKPEYVPTKDEDGDDEGEELGESLKSASPTDLEKAKKRKDVSEADKKRAEGEYGDVEYADETNKKYPIDTKEHVKAAASYFGMPKNREKYSAEDQKKIDNKIAAAKKKFGIGEDTKKAEESSDMEKDIDNNDLQKVNELIELKKSGKSISQANMEKLTKLSHSLNEMGAMCKCDKCAKMYGGDDNADDTANKTAKAAESADMHKSNDNSDYKEKLDKAMKGYADLQKAFESFKSENEALLKRVNDLENSPLPGGPIAQGTVQLDKNIGIDSAHQNVATEFDTLKKLCDEESDPMVKQAISQKIATLEMKKAQSI